MVGVVFGMGGGEYVGVFVPLRMSPDAGLCAVLGLVCEYMDEPPIKIWFGNKSLFLLSP